MGTVENNDRGVGVKPIMNTSMVSLHWFCEHYVLRSVCEYFIHIRTSPPWLLPVKDLWFSRSLLKDSPVLSPPIINQGYSGPILIPIPIGSLTVGGTISGIDCLQRGSNNYIGALMLLKVFLIVKCIDVTFFE